MNEHDTIEKLSDSILSLIDHCLPNSHSSLNSLLKLQSHYEQISREEESEENSVDDYFIKISNKINLIIKNINNKNREL